jgi:hypothetical protein
LNHRRGEKHPHDLSPVLAGLSLGGSGVPGGLGVGGYMLWG